MAIADKARQRDRWLWALLAVGVVAFGLNVMSRAKVRPGELHRHRTDVTVYTQAAEAVLAGRDPYGEPNPRGWQYTYPPLFAILMVPLVPLIPPVEAGVFYAASVALGLAMGRWCERLERGLATEAGVRGPSEALRWLIIVGVLLPVLNTLQRGQVGVILGALLCGGVAMVVLRRELWAAVVGGLMLSLAMVIKVTPLVPAGAFAAALGGVALRRWWLAGDAKLMRPAAGAAVGLVAGLALFIVVVPAAVMGHEQNKAALEHWVEAFVMTPHREHLGVGTYSPRNQNLAMSVYRIGNHLDYHFAGGPHPEVESDEGPTPDMWSETATAAALVKVGRVALVLMLVVPLCLVVWRGGLTDVVAIGGLGATLSLLGSPISWGHHYVIQVLALVGMAMFCIVHGREKWAWWLCGSCAAMVVLHYATLKWTGDYAMLGIGMTGWYAAATGLMSFVLWRERSRAACPGPEQAEHGSGGVAVSR